MISYHNGDLLKSNCKIICHQVNLQGIMGGGLALQIANTYPNIEERYRHYTNLFYFKGDLLGRVYWFKTESGQIIANCFTQSEKFDTVYSALYKALNRVKKYALSFEQKARIGIPYNYGCGIANGDWQKVESIIKNVFENSTLDCQIWKL